MSLDEILKKEDWINGLTAFAEKNKLKDDPNGIVFSFIGVDLWLKVLSEASPDILTRFREWLRRFYPSNIIYKNRQHDIDVLVAIAERIEPEKTEDLIVRNLLKWLKDDIERVCALYAER